MTPPPEVWSNQRYLSQGTWSCCGLGNSQLDHYLYFPVASSHDRAVAERVWKTKSMNWWHWAKAFSHKSSLPILLGVSSITWFQEKSKYCSVLLYNNLCPFTDFSAVHYQILHSHFISTDVRIVSSRLQTPPPRTPDSFWFNIFSSPSRQ